MAVGARHGAAVLGLAARVRADDHVVRDRVERLVAVLDVDAGAAHVGEDVVAHDRLVRAVHDEPALLRVLDGVALEEARGARLDQVHVEAVLAEHAALSAPLDARVAHADRTAGPIMIECSPIVHVVAMPAPKSVHGTCVKASPASTSERERWITSAAIFTSPPPSPVARNSAKEALRRRAAQPHRVARLERRDRERLRVARRERHRGGDHDPVAHLPAHLLRVVQQRDGRGARGDRLRQQAPRGGRPDSSMFDCTPPNARTVRLRAAPSCP